LPAILLRIFWIVIPRVVSIVSSIPIIGLAIYNFMSKISARTTSTKEDVLIPKRGRYSWYYSPRALFDYGLVILSLEPFVLLGGLLPS